MAIDPNTPSFLQALRRGLYMGVERCCLDHAWTKMDEFRESQTEVRLFRGEMTSRPHIPLSAIARRLHRDTGTISRWFQGQSPSWGNLLMAMTALGADWPNLDRLPSTRMRRNFGMIAALRLIRRRVLEEKSAREILTPMEFEWIETMFRIPGWAFERQLPNRRQQGLVKCESALGQTIARLDALDRTWGMAYEIFRQVYDEIVSDNLWA